MNLLDGPVELMDNDETLTVVRQGRAVDADMAYVDGLPVASHPPTTFDIICTVQPMDGRDLLLVPESFRTRESLWLWMRHDDIVSQGNVIDVADVVVRLGRAYQVQSSEHWGSYSRCVLVAIDVGPYRAIIDAQAPPAIYPEAV